MLRPDLFGVITTRLGRTIEAAVTGLTSSLGPLARATQQAGEAFERFKLAAGQALPPSKQ